MDLSARTWLRFLASGLVLLVLGCRSPWSAPVPQPKAPIRVTVAVRPADADTERLFTDSLRQEVAAFGPVSPAEAEDAGAAALRVTVELLDRSQAVSDQALSAASSTASQGASASVQGKDRIAVTAIFVVAAYPIGAAVGEVRALAANVRLGYQPRHLRVRVEFTPPANAAGPKAGFTTDAFEVVGAMRHLTKGEIRQPERLRQEEGLALAKVVVNHLREAGWQPLPTDPAGTPPPPPNPD